MEARSRAEGSIYTFYSYKGGVGRTMALANVAWLLASWGYKVLCIDWDLEAPGLPRYFPEAGQSQDGGLVSFIEGVARVGDADWRPHVQVMQMRGVAERLHLLPAGAVDAAYATRVQELDWKRLYKENDFGTVVEMLRREWKSAYDFVLIDSRTGVTDIGGLCTVQAPDALVALLSANYQNLDGLVGVLSRANESRDSLPYDRARLPVLPVITRLEATVEVDLTRRWFGRISQRLAPFLDAWGHKDVSVEEILTHTRIPHVARWSFGEELPVFQEGTSDPLSIGYAYETLAAVIANGLTNSHLLVANRQAYVETAARGGAIDERDASFDFDVFVSFQRSDQEFAMALADALERAGLKVFRDTPEGAASLTSSERLESSRNLVPVLSERPTHWAENEFRQFLVRALTADRPGAVVPVVLTDPRDALPHVLRGFVSVNGAQGSVTEVAQTVIRRLQEQDLTWYRQRYGPDHPATQRVVSLYTEATGDAAAVLDWVEPVEHLDDTTRRLKAAHSKASREDGPYDSRTLEALQRLADHRFGRGYFVRAAADQENVFRGYERTLGGASPRTVVALERLALMLDAAGDTERADWARTEIQRRRTGELR